MTLYHFETTLDAIVKGVMRCPSLVIRMDESKLRLLQPLFTKHFPDSTMMRNSVGHISDWLRTPESLEYHAYKGTYHQDGLHISSGIKLMGHRSGRKLILANKGRLASIELTPEWLQRLLEVQQAANAAFGPVSKPQQNPAMP